MRWQAFRDRRDAGQQLARALDRFKGVNALVLALPRGGVPVAYEVASALRGELDVLLVKKLGAPGEPELGIGAVVDGHDPQIVWNEEAIRLLRPSPAYKAAETARQLQEIERRRQIYFAGRMAPSVRGRTVILVDDGIATGGTVTSALRALRGSGASRLILAVPVAPADAIEPLRREADEVVCLVTPEPFRAVGLHYEDFAQTSDEEVLALLGQARANAMDDGPAAVH